ncbi:MAG TPA: L-threonylcarbamoyladenylate synthase [Candidatus Paceibacterota bacterium]|nr:L-threonylcarbamoyladenylate synthase [Candidatus Paceibacterota bacterium]
MERISVSDPAAVAHAAAVLASGGVILYPTDTLYGLGADALSDTALAKVHKIKGSGERKPVHAIVADIAMAAEYGEVNTIAKVLAERFLPGPLTLILKKRAGIDSGIARYIGTFGIRIPKNDFCLELSRSFGKPFTTTSANKSSMMPGRTINEILAQLGDGTLLLDLIIDAGELPVSAPSTVVDVSSGSLIFLREGAIPRGDIDKVVLL